MFDAEPLCCPKLGAMPNGHPRGGRSPHPDCTPVGLLGILSSVASTDRATTLPVSSHDLLTITNPPPGHAGVIGVKHAERWVRQGRAFFEAGGKLRLMERHRKALAHSLRGSASSGLGYDSIRRQMLERERRHIPISQPPPRVTKRKIGEGDASWKPKRLVAAHAGGDRRLRQVQAGELTPAQSPPPAFGSFPG